MNLSKDSHKYIKCVCRRQTVAVRRWFVCRNGRSFWRASFRNKNSSYTDYNCWTNLATRTKPCLTRARTLSTQVRATASRLKNHIWKLSSKYFVSGLILEKQDPNNVGNSECAFMCVCQIAPSSSVLAPNPVVSTGSNPMAAPLQSESTVIWVMEVVGSSFRDGSMEQRSLTGVPDVIPVSVKL